MHHISTLLDQLLAKALSGGVIHDQAIITFTDAVHHAASSGPLLDFIKDYIDPAIQRFWNAVDKLCKPRCNQ